MGENCRMPDPQPARRHLTPWAADDPRSYWTCAHSIGYDGTHLWWQGAALDVVIPCGS